MFIIWSMTPKSRIQHGDSPMESWDGFERQNNSFFKIMRDVTNNDAN